ncbi:MAG: hypothetical protein IPJ46_12870 [Anaerolineales bacterium]|nr:hypothetical protein [Anaerolineales bacterium]
MTHVVLGTTSHGWAQHRVDACEFDIGVVTNITHEHFDEHGGYEIIAAKARLFSSLELTKEKPQGIRVWVSLTVMTVPLNSLMNLSKHEK